MKNQGILYVMASRFIVVLDGLKYDSDETEKVGLIQINKLCGLSRYQLSQTVRSYPITILQDICIISVQHNDLSVSPEINTLYLQLKTHSSLLENKTMCHTTSNLYSVS